MKYLGLDLGTKTLGVAISNNGFVSPYKLIEFKREDYEKAKEELLKIIKEKDIKEVALGLPKNMDNSLGFAAERSLNFKSMLEDSGLIVHLYDERLTSVISNNILKENGVKKINKQNKTDILSAVIILEDYLKANSYGKWNNIRF